MNDVIDLTPQLDEPILTTTGVYYAALRAEGHSDFIAVAFMRSATRASGEAVHGVEAVRAFLRGGPSALSVPVEP